MSLLSRCNAFVRKMQAQYKANETLVLLGAPSYALVCYMLKSELDNYSQEERHGETINLMEQIYYDKMGSNTDLYWLLKIQTEKICEIASDFKIMQGCIDSSMKNSVS